MLEFSKTFAIIFLDFFFNNILDKFIRIFPKNIFQNVLKNSCRLTGQIVATFLEKFIEILPKVLHRFWMYFSEHVTNVFGYLARISQQFSLQSHIVFNKKFICIFLELIQKFYKKKLQVFFHEIFKI